MTREKAQQWRGQGVPVCDETTIQASWRKIEARRRDQDGYRRPLPTVAVDELR